MSETKTTNTLAEIKVNPQYRDWFVWYTPLMGPNGWHIVNKFQYGNETNLDDCPAVAVIYPEPINV